MNTIETLTHSTVTDAQRRSPVVLRRARRLRSAIYPNPTDNRERAAARPTREEVTV